MTTPPMFPGFDGLMTLSRREGVDIRPTLLRVLTDLYVQASTHSARRRAAVRRTDLPPDRPGRRRDARGGAGAACDLSGHAGRNPEKARPEARGRAISRVPRRAARFPLRPGRGAAGQGRRPRRNCGWQSNLSMQPNDAAEISDMFFARQRQRARADPAQSRRNAAAGFGANSGRPRRARDRDAGDGGVCRRRRELHPRARRNPDLAGAGCRRRWSTIPAANRWPARPGRWTCRAPVFQRVLLFLKPEFGSSVHNVYRLSRLYDRLSERSALIMLAAWRGSTMAVTRAKYRPSLYDDERHRARAAPAAERARRRSSPAPVSCRARGRTASAIRRQLGLRPAPDRENAARPCPRSRRSRHPDRTGFPLQGALPPTASGTGCGDVGMKKRSIGRLSS